MKHWENIDYKIIESIKVEKEILRITFKNGDIVSIPIREGRSTTNVVEKIQQQSK